MEKLISPIYFNDLAPKCCGISPDTTNYLNEAFKIPKTILETNLLKVSKEVAPAFMNDREKRMGYPNACACDIPFRVLRIHMLRYGQFGVAFHKHAAINEGYFNPVFYVRRGNELYKQSHELLKKLDADAKPTLRSSNT